MPVSLTFDNGPSPGTTEHVLDVLADHGHLATFFVVGSMLERPGARELAQRAVAEGHWVGNHSLTHSTPLGHEPDAGYAEREIEATQALLGDLTHERRFFRPFGLGGAIGPHLLSRAAVDVLRDGSYTCVLWSSVPRDWEDATGWVDTALADAERLEHAVIVLHDLPTGAMASLEAFLDQLDRGGIDVVQELPADVIVMESGVASNLDGLVGA
ncbi:MAG: polysaccharide deacetylase family protein [Acidimicrobiales bacterium]